MAGMTTSSNDRRFDLIRKIAWNFYNYALNFGATGLTPPSWNDTEDVLLKKITYSTAVLVDIHP